MSTTPPRNVIYYNDGSNPIPLARISGLPYTDVILAFLVPGDNLSLTGHGGAFGSDGNPNLDDIQALQRRRQERADLRRGGQGVLPVQ